jgi:hypothetical protein
MRKKGGTNGEEDSLSGVDSDLLKKVANYRFCQGVCQQAKERSHFAKRQGAVNSCTPDMARLLTRDEKAALIRSWAEEEKEGEVASC